MSKLVRFLSLLVLVPTVLGAQQVVLDQLRDLEFRHIGPVGGVLGPTNTVVTILPEGLPATIRDIAPQIQQLTLSGLVCG